jgi:coenzyme F420 hydrogenase subunit beta
MFGNRTINEVVKNGLCTGCGTCIGICPVGALEIITDRSKGIYLPRIDAKKCITCGLCYNVCPGHSVDFEGLNSSNSTKLSYNVRIGSWLGCYIGYANDYDIRYNSASGGLVSALLIFALEEGLIDGALVTRMREDKPLEPEPFIARTPEQVISAAKSKYCPVPANIALKEIMASPGRFAVVGLPCHIQGIKKAKKYIKELREKIVLDIGIACSLNWSFIATQRLLQSFNIQTEDVKKLDYRGRGWPGSMLIQLTDGTDKLIPYREYASQFSPFPPARCTLCSDHLCELADLSCGDAWLPDVMETDKIGSSFVVSRSKIAEDLLTRAESKNALELRELEVSRLLQSQNNSLFKKKNLPARLSLFRIVGKKVPSYKQRLMKPDIADYLTAIKFYLARYVLSGDSQFMRKLFNFIRVRKRRIRSQGSVTDRTAESIS